MRLHEKRKRMNSIDKYVRVYTRIYIYILKLYYSYNNVLYFQISVYIGNTRGTFM